jgi:hypothetical protein
MWDANDEVAEISAPMESMFKSFYSGVAALEGGCPMVVSNSAGLVKIVMLLEVNSARKDGKQWENDPLETMRRSTKRTSGADSQIINK